jgi:molybdopterin synthase sulfur carrier subunit
MTVNIKFFSNIKQWMGKGELTVRLDPLGVYTIHDILRQITRSEAKDLSTLLVEEEETPRARVRIVVNGKEIHHLEGLGTKIKDGDSIAIFPLLAGG